MLSKTEIRSCAYDTVYRRGVQYQEQGRVKPISVTQRESKKYKKPELLVDADVKGSSGKTYHASILISVDDDSILNYDCSCPYTYSGMCKHCVALALEYREQILMPKAESMKGKDLSSPAPVSNTDYKLARLLDAYAAAKQSAPGDTNMPVHLECLFSGYDEKLSVECRIGRKRMLIVKNMLQLVKNVQLGAEYTYGTTLSFRHSLSAVDEESQTLLRALENNITDKYVAFADTVSYEYSNNYRSLDFFGTSLERLLSLYLGREIELNGEKIPVIDGNPSVIFRLTGGSGKAKLTGPLMGIFESGSRCFALYENKLWYCAPEFVRRVIPLLMLFRGSTSSYYAKNKREYTLSEQDYTSFCGNILPSLEGLARVETEKINLSDWAPPEPVFSVYLHKDSEDTICASVAVAYGKETRDLLAPAKDASGWHDPMEEEVKRLIEQYFPEDAGQYTHGDTFDAVIWAEQTEEDEAEEKSRVNAGSSAVRLARGDDAAWKLMESGLSALSVIADVYVDDAIRRMRVRPAPAVSIGVSLSSGLLDLNVDVEALDRTEIAGILASYRARRKYHRLKNGDFMELADSGLSALSELAEGLMLPEAALIAGRAQLPAYRALFVDSVLNDSPNVRYTRSRDFRQMIREIRDFHNGEYTLPNSLNAELRPYQADGFQWLCALYDLNLGGILADDMGLGKTLQMIALFQHAADQDEHFSALVIAPTSLLYNWESEVRRFAPALSAQIIAGPAAEREGLIGQSGKYQVNITSYDLFKRDVAHYESTAFSCLVLDEAQYIKNAATKAARSIEHLRAAHRFAMTGTPVENRLSDLWSIFNCVMPGYLYAYTTFRKEWEQPIAKEEDEVVKARLSRMVSPFLLRRKKGDVLKDLPDKLEENVYIQLSEEQEKLYRASRDQLVYNLTHSDAEEVKRDRIKILAALTRLRQLCCSPALCYENYAGGSGKVDACLELLQNAVSAGHRVLVFSQFTSMLELLIQQWEGQCLYLSGKDNKQQRREMVDAFQRGEAPVFFISLKAGGTGLNLTKADIVIHCDPWWNVAAQNQATDRAHRIGQKNTVNVLRLVARNTIEEKIMELQAKKTALADAVVSGQGTDSFTLDKEELMALFSERMGD